MWILPDTSCLLRVLFGLMLTNLWLLGVGASLHAVAQESEYHNALEPLPADEAAQRMRVPEGFRVTLFAGEPDVRQPIGFCLDDRARLWVAEAFNYPDHGTTAGDRIIILEDTDGDGRHDRRKVFYDGLNYVSGIEVGFGGVWVMSPPFMYFIADRDGDDVPDGEPQVLLDGFGNHDNAHNIANGFAWGPDGWLYATHGRTNWSMIGRPGDDDAARRRFDGGVWRYHPVRHVWEPYADGTTNPWGIDWNDVGDAFVCNCVNPHVFQVIQGAHYEPWRGRESSQYAYQRIDTIADHLHFVGLSNVRQGLGSEAEDTAGGGHAHCGTMIYLADHFPAEYRGQLFTNNIHGRRINMDRLKPRGSGYVASHGPDLMRSEDPWFMGVTLAYGPGGEVYVSDWSDTGECHSVKNTRRHTGRIYRITYLGSQVERPSLSDRSTLELVALQQHDNDWWVRHSRRLLQERTAAGQSMAESHAALIQLLDDGQQSTAKRLRALWALKGTDGLDDRLLERLLQDQDENLRSWAVTLACENGRPSPGAMTRMVELAASGDSARVRLSLASALQRLSHESRWELAEALALRREDANDANLPLMVWYGIEPLIEHDLDRYVELAVSVAISQIRQNMARRVASYEHDTDGLARLVTAIDQSNEADVQDDLLTGILSGLEGRGGVPMPQAWPAVFASLKSSDFAPLRRHAMELAMVFADPGAIDSLKATVVNSEAPIEQRREAMEALYQREIGDLQSMLVTQLTHPELRETALRGLARYELGPDATRIVAHYSDYTAKEKQFALQALASRPSGADVLLQGIESGAIASVDLTAFTARQLQSLGDDDLTSRLARVWGNVRQTPADRTKRIESLQKSLTSTVLAQADLAGGQRLFEKHCAACHRFFGQGGSLGPDLTGAQRTNLQYMLENMIDPSASVAKEFRMQILQTEDGRVLTGLIEGESGQSITLINATDRFVLSNDSIVERKTSEVSVMPEGLLDSLSEREVRDLIGYLQR